MVERDVLMAKVLDILLQQRCCWAVLGFSAPVPKGWPDVNSRSPSLTFPLFPDDHTGGSGVPRVTCCCCLPSQPCPKAVSG